MTVSNRPIVSPRCTPPTAAQHEAMARALEEVMNPAIGEALRRLHDPMMVLDLLLSAYINLGIRVEGAVKFAETLGEL